MNVTAPPAAPRDLPVLFLPGPRRFALVTEIAAPHGAPLTTRGTSVVHDVVTADGEHVTVRCARVEPFEPADSLAHLLAAWETGEAHPTAVFWGAVCAEALALVAAGRVLPGAGFTVEPADGSATTRATGPADGQSSAGRPRWRVGPLDGAGQDRVAALVGAMPAEARSFVIPPGDNAGGTESTGTADVGAASGRTGTSYAAGATMPAEEPAPHVPAAEPLVRAALDAVADHLVREAARSPLPGDQIRDRTEHPGPRPGRHATSKRTDDPHDAPDPLAQLLADDPQDAATATSPALDEWLDEVRALLDPRVRLSLRLEPLAAVDGPTHSDPTGLVTVDDPAGAGPAGAADTGSPGQAPQPDLASSDWRATVVVHEETRARGAAYLWAAAGTDPAARDAVTEVLVRLRAGAAAWPTLEHLLDQPVPADLTFAPADVHELLSHGADALARVGITVEWPAALADQVRSVAVFTPEQVPGAAPDVHQEGTALGALGALVRGGAAGRVGTRSASPMTLTHELTLDGVRLTAAEREHLASVHARGRSAVVQLRGRWVLAEPVAARAAARTETRPVTALDAVAAALTGSARVGETELDVVATPWLDRLRAELEDPRPARDVVVPAGLAATLRDYQLDGLRWLARLTGLGLGACLADDMGLGKTITLVALHLHRQESARAEGATGARPTLVVCPASLLGSWEAEIRRFAPGVPVRRFHGIARDLTGAEDGFVLTTYGTLLADARAGGDVGPGGARVLAAHRWGLVVADEAQHVKNASTATARALRTVPADARVALTGTPVENDLVELWSILDWLNPGLLGTRGQFRRRWADPIAETRDPVLAEKLARLVRPFLLRRHKADPGIAPALPPKTVTDVVVPMTPEQVGLYEEAVRTSLAEIADAEGMGRRARVGALLTHLKQICNHPAQYLHEGLPPVADPGGADPSVTGRHGVERPGAGGREAIRLAGRSGKLDAFGELVATIRAEGSAILVFTQYVAMARLLETYLARRGVPTMLLHGGTSVARREEMVREFQEAGSEAPPVFLLSLRAAGTGLTLTRADHVVHVDRWWNPAVEEQATDRAYRIGQTKPVQVHRLVTEGTIEEHIARMIESKRELADAVLTSGEAAFTELSLDDLADLVTLRGAPPSPLSDPASPPGHARSDNPAGPSALSDPARSRDHAPSDTTAEGAR